MFQAGFSRDGGGFPPDGPVAGAMRRGRKAVISGDDAPGRGSAPGAVVAAGVAILRPGEP